MPGDGLKRAGGEGCRFRSAILSLGHQSLSLSLSVPRTGNYLPNSSNLRANESPKYIRNGVIIPSRQLSTSPDFNNNVHIRIHTCLPPPPPALGNPHAQHHHQHHQQQHRFMKPAHVSALLCFASYFELDTQCHVASTPFPLSMSMSLDATRCFILWHRLWHSRRMQLLLLLLPL